MSQDQHTPIAKPAPDATTGAEQDMDKEFKSVGRRVHNEITYRGVDFLLNSAVGIAFTYWTQRTESGKKRWAEPVSNFFKTILKPVLKTPEALEQGAKRGSMFTSIIVGGTAIIAPMVLLEKKKNKKAIITKINERVYGEETVHSDPRFAEELHDIDNEPKKNFAVGMAARLIVLAPMIAATTNPAADKYLVKYLYNPISKGTKGICNAFGIRPKYLVERGAMEVIDGDLSKGSAHVSDWDFIHKVAGFDFGLTFIYSFAHEATIKTLAAIGFKNTEEKLPEDKIPLVPVLSAAERTEAPRHKASPHKHTPQTSASVTELLRRPEAISPEVVL